MAIEEEKNYTIVRRGVAHRHLNRVAIDARRGKLTVVWVDNPNFSAVFSPLSEARHFAKLTGGTPKEIK